MQISLKQQLIIFSLFPRFDLLFSNLTLNELKSQIKEIKLQVVTEQLEIKAFLTYKLFLYYGRV